MPTLSALVLLLAVASASPPARDGVLSIDDATVVHSLEGTWRFHVGDDVAWASPTFDDTTWPLSVVPKPIGAQGLTDYAGPFWYRLRIHAPPPPSIAQTSIAIFELDSAYELYADGVRIGGRGSVVEPQEDDVGHPGVWLLPHDALDDGEVVIALRGFRSALRQSANPPRGGFTHGPDLIGPTDAIARDSVAVDLDRFVLIGGFVVAGVYHLELFRRRRAMREYLWFGLFSLAVSAYVAGQIEYVADAFGSLHDKAALVTVFMCIPLFQLFVWVFLREPIRWWWRVWHAVNAAWAVLAMAWPTSWLVHRFLLEWEICILIPVMAASIVLIGKRAWRGDPEARTVAVGVLFLMATSVNNILRTVGFQTPEVTNYAFGAFVLTMAVSLSNRFTRAYDEIDALLAKTLRLSKLKDEFLANTSHELRTPLNTIINLPLAVLDDIAPRPVVVCGACGEAFVRDDDDDGDDDDGDGSGGALDGVECPSCGEERLSIEMRRMPPEDIDALARHMQSVAHHGEHLLAVTSDLLDASKLSTGTMDLDRTAVDVADVVAAAVAAVQARAQAAKVDVNVKLERGVAVTGDRQRLVQAVKHLLDNAIAFSPAAGAVDVVVARIDAGVEVRVVDRGPGIDAAHHELIFEAFRQVDAGHTRKHGGTGLGLAIVKGLLALHGGAIRVESAAGSGATFIVTLPLAR